MRAFLNHDEQTQSGDDWPGVMMTFEPGPDRHLALRDSWPAP
jgi:hypothetical protein